MPEWEEEWAGVCNGDFPCLHELIVEDCPTLRGTMVLSSSLEVLSIRNCWNLTSLVGLPNLTSLAILKLECCPILQPFLDETLPWNPRHVKIVNCTQMTGIFGICI